MAEAPFCEILRELPSKGGLGPSKRGHKRGKKGFPPNVRYRISLPSFPSVSVRKIPRKYQPIPYRNTESGYNSRGVGMGQNACTRSVVEGTGAKGETVAKIQFSPQNHPENHPEIHPGKSGARLRCVTVSQLLSLSPDRGHLRESDFFFFFFESAACSSPTNHNSIGRPPPPIKGM